MTPGSEILPADAVRLLDDLTGIIARACAEIRAISPVTVVQRIKPDQSPVTVADEAFRSDNSAGSGAIAAGRTGHFRRIGPPTGQWRARQEFPDCRSARWHTRVSLPAAMSSPSISPLSRAACRSPGLSLRRNAARSGAALSAREPNGCACWQTAPTMREAIHTRRWPDHGAVATVSRSHFDSATPTHFSHSLGPITRHAAGSAIKFCQIAEGDADIYPRLATTCEWDVAAGHALVVAAGGKVMSPQGLAVGTMVAPRKIFVCPPSWRGEMRERPHRSPPEDARGDQGLISVRACVRHSGHFRSAVSMMRPGSARKAARVFLAIEEIEPLTDHDPDQRMSRNRTIARRSPPDRSRQNGERRPQGARQKPRDCLHW